MKQFIISMCTCMVICIAGAVICHNNMQYLADTTSRYILNIASKNAKRKSIAIQQAASIESEVFRSYATQKIDKLRNGLDNKSNEVLNYVLDSMVHAKFLKDLPFEKSQVSFPKEHVEHMNRYKSERAEYKKHNLGGYHYASPEVFYFHHGLRFAAEKLRNYIQDKDIIDCGAFIWDSFLVLKEYTNAKVYCYEFSDSNISEFFNVMKLNHVQPQKYELVPVALSDHCGRMSVEKGNGVNSSRLLKTGTGYEVEITTIDEEAKKRNFNVGFIKIDVEGDGMRIIKGAIETIKKHRPVLSIGVYHNREELFNIKPYLEEHLKDYVFEFHLQGFSKCDFNELILFCYPKEL